MYMYSNTYSNIGNIVRSRILQYTLIYQELIYSHCFPLSLVIPYTVRETLMNVMAHLITVLKHHSQLQVSVEYVNKTYNVLVFEFLEQADLSESSTRHSFIIFVKTDYLQRHYLTTVFVLGLVHCAICT